MDKKIKPPILGGFLMFGGDDRDRTDYLLNAIQALSQVSYAPATIYDVFIALSQSLIYRAQLY